MRADQYERLQALSEKLTDVFLVEADPDKWTGAGTPMAEWSKQQRGDRYWEKKNAVATVALVQRVGQLVAIIQDDSNKGSGAAAVEEEEGERLLDEEIAAAEAEATKLLDKMSRVQMKAAFDARTYGKS